MKRRWENIILLGKSVELRDLLFVQTLRDYPVYASLFSRFSIPHEERGKRLNSSRENEEIPKNLRPNFLSKLSP